jgi:hypothetical protein
MATGRAMQLTRQIGEHLVAAKLGRMGYVATPFAGNVPMFDLLVADQRGYAVPVQVKAINGPSWQFRADMFLDIEIVDGEQKVRGTRVLLNPDLLCVFVVVRQDERDEFYVFKLKDLQALFSRSYKGGRRPKNPGSLHCAVWPKDLQEFRDNWQILHKAFPPGQEGG